MKAHQRVIREQMAKANPRPVLASLSGCRVESITVVQATAIILKYEWLGTMNWRPAACYGLWSPTRERELLGVVSFGHAGSPEAHDVCGPEFRAQTIVLERGACVHWAPKNAASFLIRHAVRLAHREHGWSIFIAYCDPDAGEIGTIYQAATWTYIGVGRHGRPREEFRKPGEATWHSERILGHSGLKKAKALALGWDHRQRAAKHRYVWFADHTMASLCRYPSLPYPKRWQAVGEQVA